MKKISPEFSYIVDVRQIPSAGMTLDIQADEVQCRALANRFNIPSVNKLSAKVNLMNINKDRVRVKGTFEAQVEQICVVSLEKFMQKVQSGEIESVLLSKNSLSAIPVDKLCESMTYTFLNLFAIFWAFVYALLIFDESDI